MADSYYIGDEQPDDADVLATTVFPARIAAIRESGVIMLPPHEVRYAESDGHIVWLQTDQGRMRAAVHGFTNIARKLSSLGFLRVHRRYIVNVGRIQQVNRALNGTLVLTTDTETHETIPVSRRNVAQLCQILDI